MWLKRHNRNRAKEFRKNKGAFGPFVCTILSMDIFLQLVVSVVIPATVFGLVALGFTLVASVCRFLPLAHGALVLASGYGFYVLTILWPLPPLIAAMIVCVATASLGGFINLVVYERFRGRRSFNAVVALIVAVAVMMIIENILLLVFGSQTKIIPMLLGGSLMVAGAEMTIQESIMVVFVLMLALATGVFWQWSAFGRSARAIADNEEAAEILGIDARRIRTLTVGIASALAAVSGICFALEYGLQPGLTTTLAIKAFGRAVVGGIGSIPGAIVGSFFLDIAETSGAWFWNSAYKEVVSFMVVFLFLLYRPSGIFGKK